MRIVNRILETDETDETDHNHVDSQERKEILRILYAGTSLSALCSAAVVWTFVFTKSLRERRALSHMVVKSVGCMTMALGYWMDWIAYGSNCNGKAFCAFQFVLLQMGNVAIMVAELALTNEIFALVRKFQSRSLQPSIGTPIGVQTTYVLSVPFAVLSISVGLAFYLSEDEDNGLECYYDAWCWYESVAMQMAFKFAILDVIIISALIVRLHLYPQPNP